MDADHLFGGGLSLDASGDLLMTDGSTYGTERVLRRLLTNPNDYIWHADYGGGLRRFVGQVANIPRITAVILRQMKLESAVSQQPGPSVAVALAGNSTVTASITYVDAPSGTTASVALPLAAPASMMPITPGGPFYDMRNPSFAAAV